MGMKATAAENKSKTVFSHGPWSPDFYLLPSSTPCEVDELNTLEQRGNFYQLWLWLTHRVDFGEIKKKQKNFALSPDHKTRCWSVCQEIKVSKFHIDGRSRWRASCLGVGVCHLLWDRHEGECGVNVGSWLSAVSQLYMPRGTTDMRRAETTAMTWWGTRGLYCHTTTILIQHCKAFELYTKSYACCIVCKH